LILYVDSSSIVKLYVPEAGSAETNDVVSNADRVATSLLAYAEVRAALARARRDRRIRTVSSYARCKNQFEQDWPTYLQLAASEGLIHSAGDLAERHALSGFDSVHLSAALALSSGTAEEIQVSTWDQRLAAAAIAEGLSLAHEVKS
jgi:predicted nucleic acid-binding protein